MRYAIATLILVSAFWVTAAEDKKNPRSLAEDAAYLAEKSSKLGWESEEVTVSAEDGKKTAKATLRMKFRTDKDKPSGRILLVVRSKAGEEARQVKFELSDADGKRSMKLIDNKETATIEYSTVGDKLTIKGDVIRKSWATWDVDPTKGITFKPGAK